MVALNDDGTIQPDRGLSAAVDSLEREKFVERAYQVRWSGAPQWAWKYIGECVFGQQRAYWASENEADVVRTEPAFEVADGERVVIPLDWE